MQKIFILFLSIIIMSLSFCSTHVRSEDIDEFILKYDKIKFDRLHDISIVLRSKAFNHEIYAVSRYSGNFPVYFVTYDLQKNFVSNIDKSNLVNTHTAEYLTSDEINNAVSTIRKHNFFLLAVDSSENIYINPFHADEPAYLLRLRSVTGDSVINSGYIYDLYNNHWYLNRSSRASN
jgi:hypothetical protein